MWSRHRSAGSFTNPKAESQRSSRESSKDEPAPAPSRRVACYSDLSGISPGRTDACSFPGGAGRYGHFHWPDGRSRGISLCAPGWSCSRTRRYHRHIGCRVSIDQAVRPGGAIRAKHGSSWPGASGAGLTLLQLASCSERASSCSGRHVLSARRTNELCVSAFSLGILPHRLRNWYSLRSSGGLGGS